MVDGAQDGLLVGAGGEAMIDLIIIIATIAFFAVAIGYVAACDRL